MNNSGWTLYRMADWEYRYVRDMDDIPWERGFMYSEYRSFRSYL